MEPKCSSLYSQKPTTRLYPEQDWSSLRPTPPIRPVEDPLKDYLWRLKSSIRHSAPTHSLNTNTDVYPFIVINSLSVSSSFNRILQPISCLTDNCLHKLYSDDSDCSDVEFGLQCNSNSSTMNIQYKVFNFALLCQRISLHVHYAAT
jgi:hypothetical protein